MKVKFIKSPTGAPHNLAYFIDDVAEFQDEYAQTLIDTRFAVKAEPEPPAEPEISGRQKSVKTASEKR